MLTDEARSLLTGGDEENIAMDGLSLGEIQQLEQSRLLSASYAEIRRLQCSIVDGVLCLRGQVSSYFFKQQVVRLFADLDVPVPVAIHVKVNY